MGQIIYTDAQGQGYDLPALTAAWNTPAFRNDPMNGRVGDILSQYQSAPAGDDRTARVGAAVYSPPATPTPTANPIVPGVGHTDGGTPTTTPTTPQTSFTNTSPTKPSVPTGIADPRNPGFDTAGYRLGATDVNGVINIPNTVTGQISTVIQNPTGQPNPQGNPFASFTPMPAAGGGGGTGGTGGAGGTNATGSSTGGAATGSTADWASLIRQIYGPPPAIPQPAAFSYGAFSAPSGQDVLNADPGYQFRLDQGTQALQQSAAARGVLNTGGTLQDLINYGQNAASQEYSDAYNRAYNTWQGNAANALQQYQENYLTGTQNPYLAAFNQYTTNAGLQNQLFNQNFSTINAG